MFMCEMLKTPQRRDIILQAATWMFTCHVMLCEKNPDSISVSLQNQTLNLIRILLLTSPSFGYIIDYLFETLVGTRSPLYLGCTAAFPFRLLLEFLLGVDFFFP